MLKKNIPPKESMFNVSRKEWNDWRWHVKNSIHTLSQLSEVFNIPRSNLEIYRRITDIFHFSITPYYLSLIDWQDKHDPIRLQCFPDIKEIDFSLGGVDDPLDEKKDMVVPELIHRYHDRCLAMITSTCATYCRHCNRKRRWKESAKECSKEDLEKMLHYISQKPQIREVILSGGDPLMMNIEKLEWFLQSLKAIPHVEMLRIGSRIPVVMPMRIDDDLCRMLQKYRPLWVVTQFNHPREITTDSSRACEMLLRYGIPVLNQSVLLKDINDSYEVMRNLLYGLQKISVKPYYLFHCEPVKGADHFRTDIWHGMEMMEKLWGDISGPCIPRYVVDLPGGKGKMPLQSFSFMSKKIKF